MRELPPVDRYNAPFNDMFRSVAGDIFVSENEFPRYVPGRPQIMDALVPLATADPELFEVVRGPSHRDPRGTAEPDFDNIGEYERLVLSHIAWGRYSVYCVLGEMGSGKTSLLAHITKVLNRPKRKLCEQCVIKKLRACEPLIVPVDLNGIDSDNPVAVANGLRRRLYAASSSALRSFFTNQAYVDEFVQHVRRAGPNSPLAIFDDLARQIDGDATWPSKTRRQKANFIAGYIAAASELEAKLEMSLIAIADISETIRREKSCAVLLVDNVDKFGADAQMALFKQVLSLQRNFKMKTLVALRPTNFLRLRSLGTMSFGVIVHSGAAPVDVVRSRIEHFLESHRDDRVFMQLNDRMRLRFINRLRDVAAALRNEGGLFPDALGCLAGNSSRLALTLMERVLINNIIRYDESPGNQGDLVRALLVGGNTGAMNLMDSNVANIFTDGQQNALSMVLLRILGFIYLFAGNRDARRIGNIIKLVCAATGRASRDVVEALDYLAFWKRPLVWADSRTEFEARPKAIRELNATTDTLNLTVAGTAYFERLIMSINYVQEATNSLHWTAPLTAPGSSFSDIDTRFRALRGALQALQAIDKTEFARYKSYQSRSALPLPPPVLVSNRIIYGVARSALRILESDRTAKTEAVNAEMLDWRNLLVMATNLENELTGQTNSRLDGLLRLHSAGDEKILARD